MEWKSLIIMQFVGGKNIMVSIRKFAATTAIGIIVLCFTSGCTTGTLISGMSSAPSGISQTSGAGSRVISYQIAHYEDVVQGAIRAAEALSLENKKKDIRENRAELSYADGKGQIVDILIEGRSATITVIQVDAGFLGPKGFPRLVLLQIIEELDEAQVLLEDWSD
jgi:hypothetical protein